MANLPAGSAMGSYQIPNGQIINSTTSYANPNAASTAANQNAMWNSPEFQSYLKKNDLQSPFDLNSSNPQEKTLAEQWYQNQQQNFVQNSGMPVRPDFNSNIDPATGLLKGNLNAKAAQISAPGQVQLNTDPLKQLEQMGSSNAPSAWANLMNAQNDQNTTKNLNSVAATAGGANAAAENSLAMRGGLNSGARTSLAKNMQQTIDANQQGVRSNAANNSLNIGVQDEANKLGIQEALPGQEIAATAPQFQNIANTTAANEFNATSTNAANQFNINNALSDILQGRAVDTNAYNQAMQAYGAQQSGNAIAGSGKK